MIITRRNLISSIAAGITVSSAACGRRFPTYRYRMTVEIDTPQGLRTGSSVIEVASGQGKFGTMGEVGATARGEAVAVDLPGNRTLFALLCSQSGRVDAAAGFAFDGLPSKVRRTGDAYAGDLAELLARRDVGVIPRAAYPLLATFGDQIDRKSIKRIDPDNLAATFGTGVALKRITVQITDDPISTGIGDRLPWLTEDYVPDAAFHPEGIPVGEFKRLFRV